MVTQFDKPNALYVKLIHLKNYKELNGTLVEVLEYDKEIDRFIVKLYNGTKAKVKIENTVEIGENLSTSNIPRVFNIGKYYPTNNKSSRKRKKTKKNITNVEECNICMDEMRGEVLLKCGHKMCPDCFARHSRKKNTCPFCRDEFAPKIEATTRLSNEIAEIMVREVVDEYFDNEEEDELERKLNELCILYLSGDGHAIRINMAVADLKATVYAHMTETARIMYQDIEEWYDENE
jgi:hypothetical protein|tara:strand:- start:300 stop:1004 length:705 start_codon:yes stop_codon:yes gene_type:complete